MIAKCWKEDTCVQHVYCKEFANCPNSRPNKTNDGIFRNVSKWKSWRILVSIELRNYLFSINYEGTFFMHYDLVLSKTIKIKTITNNIHTINSIWSGFIVCVTCKFLQVFLGTFGVHILFIFTKLVRSETPYLVMEQRFFGMFQNRKVDWKLNYVWEP